MKLSARNILKGKIVEVKKGTTTAHIRIDVGGQKLESRIIARMVPKKMPPAIARPVSVSVNTIPTLNR